MAVSIYQLGYKKLSRVIFEWQAADRASLLALFMVMEVSLHWLWCLFVWLYKDTYGTYVDMDLLYPVWLGITLMWMFAWWMVGHLVNIKNDNRYLHKWEAILIIVYSVYIVVVVLVMGHSSLVAGVSLMGGTMLAMTLVRRRYIWKAFLFQVLLILLMTVVPYLSINLPDLRQLATASIPTDAYKYLTYNQLTGIGNTMPTSIFQNGTLNWDNLHQLRLSPVFFWHSTYIYLALPKAIFIVYMFRTLLLILDKSKDEILKHANQDELTQLKSRRYGLTQMQRALMAATNQQDFSVILLDLDWFKHVNDNFGHEVGDQVLREAAQTLLDALTDQAIVSRYGGEEFLIILPNTEHNSAMAIAEKLRKNIAQHVIKVDDRVSVQVTASLGLYTLTYNELLHINQGYIPKTHAKTPKLSTLQRYKAQKNQPESDEYLDRQTTQLFSDICQHLISIADKALYKAKDRGRNQVVSANDLLIEGSIPKSRYGT